MALRRHKQNKNPNHRRMSVADMSFSVSQDNKRVLELLDQYDKRKNKS